MHVSPRVLPLPTCACSKRAGPEDILAECRRSAAHGKANVVFRPEKDCTR